MLISISFFFNFSFNNSPGHYKPHISQTVVVLLFPCNYVAYCGQGFIPELCDDINTGVGCISTEFSKELSVFIFKLYKKYATLG